MRPAFEALLSTAVHLIAALVIAALMLMLPREPAVQAAGLFTLGVMAGWVWSLWTILRRKQ